MSCHERHQFVPFSNNETGAVTTSSISLTLLEEKTFEIEEPTSYVEAENPIKTREKLLFIHYPTPKKTTGEIKNARKLLQQMCKFGIEIVSLRSLGHHKYNDY